MSNIPTVTSDRYPALSNADKATPQRLTKVLEALAAGNSLRTAAGLAGVSNDTLTDWAKADPQFSADLAEAQSSWTSRKVKVIDEAAEKNGDWKAAAWLLTKTPHTRADYGESQSKGNGGVNIILGIQRDERPTVTIEGNTE